MRVLIYYPGDLSRPTGTPIRTVNLIQALSNLGVDSTVLATAHPTDDSSIGKNFIQMQAGASWRKRVGEIRAAIRQTRPHVVYSITHVALSVGGVGAMLSRVPHFIDLHSIWAEELKADGQASSGQIWKLSALEWALLPRCAGATAVSYPLQNYYGRRLKRVELLHGGVDVRRFNPHISPSCDLKVTGKSPLLVGYIGNMRRYQGVDELFDVAVRIVGRDPDFHFVFIGEGPLKNEMAQRLDNEGLQERIRFLPQKPPHEIPSYLSACDVLVIPRPSNRITEFAFPSKLPEYLAMGKVVITTDVGDAGRFVKDGETGYLVPAGDSQSLEAVILAQKDNPCRHKIGESAFRIVEQYHTWDARAQVLLDFFGGSVNESDG